MTAAETSNPTGTKFVVAKASDVPDGSRFLVTVGNREVGIFKVRGQYFALLNRCPHLGGPLCRGQLLNPVISSGPGSMELDTSQDLITCPWHGWEFDLKTGRSYWNPEHLRTRPFPVAVEPGDEIVSSLEDGSAERCEGPYRAETIPVSIEDDYVVLTMRAPAARPTANGGTQ
jgi:nitrite reductase/ring-hydroxylating ferredoxin subunit